MEDKIGSSNTGINLIRLKPWSGLYSTCQKFLNFNRIIKGKEIKEKLIARSFLYIIS